MNFRVKTLFYLVTIALLNTGCASLYTQQANTETETEVVENSNVNSASDSSITTTLPNISLADRIVIPDESDLQPDDTSAAVYSFVAQNLPVKDALNIFSRAYNLNIIADNDVDGYISVEFHDLNLDQAMSAMLSSLDLYWEQDDNLIKVKRWVTKSLTIDYLRLVRSGQGSSLANVNSTVTGATSNAGADTGGAGTGNTEDGTFELTQEDSVEFWNELSEQLESLTSEQGRVVINTMSGTVQITDLYSRVLEVERYINQINQAIHRQVEIDVRIVEVELNDDFSLGIDWSLVTAAGSSGLQGNLGIANIISQPLGGFGAILPSASLNLFETDNRLNFDTLITALKEQGEVNVVSQPKIRTLNNQSAMIKVGTDRTFFIRTVTNDTTSAGNTTFVEDVPSVVTEGIVMALTPQIAASGWIMMDISPIITRVTSVERVLDNNGNVTSSSPNLDIRQTSSLVRMQNGNTIAIGGLMQNTESDTTRSVPGLGDLPIVGNAFRGTYKLKRKKELVIFLTANLVDTTIAQIGNK